MDLRTLKDRKSVIIMLSGFAWGIVAHGMAMFNKFSYHDDVPWFNGVGETYGLGRWALGAFGTLTEKILMGRNYSLPVFNGLLTIAAICFMACIICHAFRIEDTAVMIGLTGVMVCFPAVTNIFVYVFTAPYYYIGALLGLIGAWYYHKNKNIPSFIVCSVLMAVSTGLYQSNITINLMILLMFMLDDVYMSDMTFREYFILTAKNAGMCAAFMAEYFGINAIFLLVTGQDMYDYKGVSTFGSTDIAGYIMRIVTAYKRFIKPADHINYNGVSANMFPEVLKYLHIVLYIIVAVLIIILLKHIGNKTKILQIIPLILVSPLFSYFFYVMVAEDDAHGGMAYGEVFMFAVGAYIIERIREIGAASGAVSEAATQTVSQTASGAVEHGNCEQGGRECESREQKVCGILATAATVLIIIMAALFARFANVCYLKTEIMQQEAINYYNILIARIEQTPGYAPDVPVAYIAPRQKNDEGFKGDVLFDPIYLPPYQGRSIINDFAWEETMEMWCAFAPPRVDESQFAGNAEVDAMPCYPADGSIRMIDETIVVKFANPE